MTASSGRALVLAGGRVVCPESGVDDVRDVHIGDGRVRAVAPPGQLRPDDAEVIDVSGCVVLPGAVDLECHVRDPGREDEETLAETLAAAARGGFTTVLAMPGTEPAVDGADDVDHRLRAAESARAGAGGPDLLVAGALTAGRAGEGLAEMAEMARAGAVAFTDHPRVIEDTRLLRCAIEYASGLGRPVFATGADPALGGDGKVGLGKVSTRLGVAGAPVEAETTWVHRHIELARLCRARVHLGPLSAARSIELLRRARDEGLDVTAHVDVWHLLLDEDAHLARPFDASLALRPPLRSADDKAALLAAVDDGTLLVASGHAPLGPERRELEFERSTSGGIALPVALGLLMHDAEGRGPLASDVIARQLCRGPARLLGLPDRGHLKEGARADVVVLDPKRSAVIDRDTLGTRQVHGPLLGTRTRGGVRLTVSGGDVVHDATA